MRILIDECAPSALRHALARQGHNCKTVQEAGWSGKKNGELLSLAENEFDVLITIDTNLRYQQNRSGRKIAVVLLVARSNRLEALSPHFPQCAHALENIKPGDFVEVGDVD
jgi:predicted nuclease of predicted toxin-antitoxin system